MPRLRLLALSAAVAAPLALSGCDLPIIGNDCLEVQGTADSRAPGFLVSYRDGVPAQPTTDRLAAKYHFHIRYVFDAFPGFSADLDASALDGLRCETTLIQSIEHNQLAGAT